MAIRRIGRGCRRLRRGHRAAARSRISHCTRIGGNARIRQRFRRADGDIPSAHLRNLRPGTASSFRVKWWLVALALLVACIACLVNVRLEAGQRYSPREAAARPNRLFQGNAGTVPAIGGF